MVTGEKDFEIREKGQWILPRLFNPDGTKREYDVVKFVNGYKKNRPYFIAKYKGFDDCIYMNRTFSNGFKLHFIDNQGKWKINLGEIIETGNLQENINPLQKCIDYLKSLSGQELIDFIKEAELIERDGIKNETKRDNTD
jgi:hypothetical protein